MYSKDEIWKLWEEWIEDPDVEMNHKLRVSEFYAKTIGMFRNDLDDDDKQVEDPVDTLAAKLGVLLKDNDET